LTKGPITFILGICLQCAERRNGREGHALSF